MILFEYIFFSIYKNTSITNKWNPISSSIGVLIVLVIFNTLTALIRLKAYLDFQLNENIFYVIIAIIVGIFLYHFYSNNKAEEIIEKLNNKRDKNSFWIDLIVLIYACLSIFTFFNLLEVGYETYIILILLIIFTSTYAYLKVVKFNNK